MLLKAMLFSLPLFAAPMPPLQSVPAVELSRYVGVWYEIARYPNFFQNGCDHAKAAYRVMEDGGIEVTNTCVKPDGTLKSVVGRAEVVDKDTHAKLKVSFVPAWLRWTGLGWGDYWVVALAPDYSYAVVSEPGRKYLWILNREAVMKVEVYARVMVTLKELGFDESKLIRS
jgi:apolipoprotein D and lipocalin family protein